MANHMQKVAKMLGVELGEEFMCSNGYKYVLREDGIIELKYKNDCRISALTFAPVLNSLLSGELVIKHKFWKPSKGETFWAVYPSGRVENLTCCNDLLDRFFQKLGNCYRTEEEATHDRNKWIAFYESDEIVEV